MMPNPEPEMPREIEIICPECGDRLHVADPAGLIRALHLRDACEAVSNIVASETGSGS